MKKMLSRISILCLSAFAFVSCTEESTTFSDEQSPNQANGSIYFEQGCSSPSYYTRTDSAEIDGDLVACFQNENGVYGTMTTNYDPSYVDFENPYYRESNTVIDLQRTARFETYGAETVIQFNQLITMDSFKVRNLARTTSGSYDESQEITFWRGNTQVIFEASITEGLTTASYNEYTGLATAADVNIENCEADFDFCLFYGIDKIIVRQADCANHDQIHITLSEICNTNV